MEPTVPDGALVYYLPKDKCKVQQIQKSDIYVFMNDNELTLKRFQTRLATHNEMSDNADYLYKFITLSKLVAAS